MVPGSLPRPVDGLVRRMDGLVVGRVFEPGQWLTYRPTTEELRRLTEAAQAAWEQEVNSARRAGETPAQLAARIINRIRGGD